MTARGLPDNPRSSRHILKDFVQGKLLYCVPPPEVDPAGFQDYSSLLKIRPIKTAAAPTPHQLKVTKVKILKFGLALALVCSIVLRCPVL